MKADKKQKIAIFGGSFDPPHYAHYDIVKNLEYSFDKVIVVPSYVSPFKANGCEDAKVRLKLCKKLFTSEKTEVCSREITRKGVSYSVDTAVYLAKKYDGADMYFVIGSEEVNRLTEWHDIDRLKTLVTFLIVPRAGYDVDDSVMATLKKRKIKLKYAKFNGLDLSSTIVKIDAAFGKSNYMMPDIVRAEMDKKDLFNPYKRYVDGLHKYGLSQKRIDHIYNTTIRGVFLAKLYGGSVHDTVVACILHDIAKEVDPIAYVDKVDVIGYPDPTVHAPIGAYIAKTEFCVSDEIARAIKVHATADGAMTLLDEIVYLADKSESSRTYNEVYKLRELCLTNRNEAMSYILPLVANYRTDAVPCRFTKDAIALYDERLLKELGVYDEPVAIENGKSNNNLPIVRGSSEIREASSKSVALFNKIDKSVAVRPEKSTAIMNLQKPMPLTLDNKESVFDVATAVAKELCLHKAHDVDIIDLCGKTIVADYFVVASVSSSTAVKAMKGYVEDLMTKKFGLDPTRRDVDTEWIALDYGGLIVHVFTDKMREFYDLEHIWTNGDNVIRVDD